MLLLAGWEAASRSIFNDGIKVLTNLISNSKKKNVVLIWLKLRFKTFNLITEQI